ncbi:hypothetical protein BDR03DRAFT_350820 [Suillus americanus]|nr:hypothetical protein BDR03DRAFT_350820 [Suillus americanus]
MEGGVRHRSSRDVVIGDCNWRWSCVPHEETALAALIQRNGLVYRRTGSRGYEYPPKAASRRLVDMLGRTREIGGRTRRSRRLHILIISTHWVWHCKIDVIIPCSLSLRLTYGDGDWGRVSYCVICHLHKNTYYKLRSYMSSHPQSYFHVVSTIG